jgi:RNA polymerase primary sigma factor
MSNHHPQNIDSTWQALLNSPEAKVLSASEERDLLVELVDCRERILAAFRPPSGTDSDRDVKQTEFQQLVRDLANSATRFDPPTEPFGPLARRYQEIRTKLVMANVRLVAHIAKRYQGRGVPSGDLIQEGICALLLAIDRFDLVNATRLATYAIWWIRQGIQRVVATSAYPVRLNARHLRQLARSHEVSTEGPSNGPALAKLPNPARSQTIERLLAATRPTLSLDSPSRYDGATAVVDFLIPFDQDDAETEDVNQSVGNMIDTLDPREKVVLNLRFGLTGEPRRTLIQVGHVLGVSKERVRQIQARAMRKLRTAPIKHPHRMPLERATAM